MIVLYSLVYYIFWKYLIVLYFDITIFSTSFSNGLGAVFSWENRFFVLPILIFNYHYHSLKKRSFWNRQFWQWPLFQISQYGFLIPLHACNFSDETQQTKTDHCWKPSGPFFRELMPTFRMLCLNAACKSAAQPTTYQYARVPRIPSLVRPRPASASLPSATLPSAIFMRGKVPSI